MKGRMLYNISFTSALVLLASADSISMDSVDVTSKEKDNAFCLEGQKEGSGIMHFNGLSIEKLGKEYNGWTEYGKTIFHYDDNVYLVLRFPLKIRQVGKYHEILQWNTRLETTYEELDKAIIRYFQDLYEKARNGNMSSCEVPKWLEELYHYWWY